MVNINYTALRILILQECFHGEKTYDMSRKLGFNFDKCKRWLDGTKILRWDEFVNLGNSIGLNILEAFSITFNFFGETGNIFAYLKMRNAFESNQQVADYLNCHVSVVKRYNQQDTIPDLDTVLRMMDYNENYLSSFLFTLFGGDIKTPALRAIISEGMKAPIFNKKRISIAFVEACFGIDAFKTRTVSATEWISDFLNLSQEEVRLNLKEMVEVGVLTLEGEDNYQAVTYATNVTQGFKENIPIVQSMNQKIIEVLEEKKKHESPTSRPGLIAGQIYPTSITAMEKVNEILLKAFSDVFKVVESDPEPRTEVCLIMLEVVKLNKELNKADGT